MSKEEKIIESVFNFCSDDEFAIKCTEHKFSDEKIGLALFFKQNIEALLNIDLRKEEDLESFTCFKAMFKMEGNEEIREFGELYLLRSAASFLQHIETRKYATKLLKAAVLLGVNLNANLASDQFSDLTPFPKLDIDFFNTEEISTYRSIMHYAAEYRSEFCLEMLLYKKAIVHKSIWNIAHYDNEISETITHFTGKTSPFPGGGGLGGGHFPLDRENNNEIILPEEEVMRALETEATSVPRPDISAELIAYDPREPQVKDMRAKEKTAPYIPPFHSTSKKESDQHKAPSDTWKEEDFDYVVPHDPMHTGPTSFVKQKNLRSPIDAGPPSIHVTSKVGRFTIEHAIKEEDEESELEESNTALAQKTSLLGIDEDEAHKVDDRAFDREADLPDFYSPATLPEDGGSLIGEFGSPHCAFSPTGETMY